MEVSLPLGTWDGLRLFIVSLPGPSVNFFDTALLKGLDMEEVLFV